MSEADWRVIEVEQIAFVKDTPGWVVMHLDFPEVPRDEKFRLTISLSPDQAREFGERLVAYANTAEASKSRQ